MNKVHFKDGLERGDSLSKGYFTNISWIRQWINWRPKDLRGGYKLMQERQS